MDVNALMALRESQNQIPDSSFNCFKYGRPFVAYKNGALALTIVGIKISSSCW